MAIASDRSYAQIGAIFFLRLLCIRWPTLQPGPWVLGLATLAGGLNVIDAYRGVAGQSPGTALLMRIAGIPTRIVLGYLGGEYNLLNDSYFIRQSDAHAWNEGLVHVSINDEANSIFGATNFSRDLVAPVIRTDLDSLPHDSETTSC